MPYKRHVALLLSVLFGCATPPIDPEISDPEQPPLAARTEEKLVLASAALDNGPPWFGANVQAELSERTPLHAWTFELPGAATVSFATRGTATGPDVDTVLYLYSQGARGWGSYLVRNDDYAGTVFSSLSRALQPGRYRVVVKGRTQQVSGPFALSAACEGAGCQPPEPQECVFGSRVTDLPRQLRVSNILTYTSVEQLPDALARAQLVSSAAQLPGASVGSAEQLFARADSGLVRWLRIWDDVGGRQFVAYEYRVDDHSYGAVFAVDGGDVVARVQDALLVDCHVPAERCVLGSSYPELRESPRFEVLTGVELTAQSAALLSSNEQAQLLEAVRVGYEDAVDLAAAFESVDANRIEQLVLNEIATGRHIVVYEYGAGDNSFGGVFAEAGTALLTRIEDGAFIACMLRE